MQAIIAIVILGSVLAGLFLFVHFISEGAKAQKENEQMKRGEKLREKSDAISDQVDSDVTKRRQSLRDWLRGDDGRH